MRRPVWLRLVCQPRDWPRDRAPTRHNVTRFRSLILMLENTQTVQTSVEDFRVLFLAVYRNRNSKKTSYGVRHNKPRPLLPPSEWYWLVRLISRHGKSAATKPVQTRCPIPLAVILTTNTLTFDPPTRLPELTQNVIRSSHGHSLHTFPENFMQISCKFHRSSRFLVVLLTKKQRNK